MIITTRSDQSNMAEIGRKWRCRRLFYNLDALYQPTEYQHREEKYDVGGLSNALSHKR